MKTPIIETERMILRPLSLDDAEVIYKRWTSDDRVSKYMRWFTHSSAEDTKEWLKTVVESTDSDIEYNWGFTLKETGYLFGSGSIISDKVNGVFELGYNIMYDFWNKGYTTEAARAIIDFAHSKLHINEFIAAHAVENPASGAVMKKCGFIYEKNEIHTKFDGVTSYDSKLYRLKL